MLIQDLQSILTEAQARLYAGWVGARSHNSSAIHIFIPDHNHPGNSPSSPIYVYPGLPFSASNGAPGTTAPAGTKVSIGGKTSIKEFINSDYGIRMYGPFIKLIKSQKITDQQLLDFGANILAQVIASGADEDKYFSFKAKLPTQDDIIRGILKIYKDEPKEVKRFISNAKKLGYKIPDDVLGAISKSITHTRKTEEAARHDSAVAAAKSALDRAHQRHEDAVARRNAFLKKHGLES